MSQDSATGRNGGGTAASFGAAAGTADAPGSLGKVAGLSLQGGQLGQAALGRGLRQRKRPPQSRLAGAVERGRCSGVRYETGVQVLPESSARVRMRAWVPSLPWSRACMLR